MFDLISTPFEFSFEEKDFSNEKRSRKKSFLLLRKKNEETEEIDFNYPSTQHLINQGRSEK